MELVLAAGGARTPRPTEPASRPHRGAAPVAGGTPAEQLRGPLRVLLVEDVAADAALTVARLGERMPDVELTHVVRLSDAVRALADAEFDVALLDLAPPDTAVLEAVRVLREARPTLATVVVLSGCEHEGLARQALESGAQDYVHEDDLDAERLVRALRDAATRTRAEAGARSSRDWAQSVLESIDAPTCVLDRAGSIVAVNRAWHRFTVENGGVPERCGVGADYLAVCEATDEPQVRRLAVDLRRLLATGTGRVELDYPCPAPDRPRWFTLRATPAVGLGAAVLTHVEVTALRQAHEERDRAATHDPLTGVANRRLLVCDLALRLARRTGAPAVTALVLGLDRFKAINDRHGHTVGDAVLVRVAEELTAVVRRGDLVARHGGDEFVVLADVVDETEALALASRLHAALSRTIRVGDADVDLRASIGVAVSVTGSDDDADDVLQAVDDAVREAKAHGGSRIELSSASRRERARQRAGLSRELALAVERREFVLHFQPVVAPEVGGVHAVEALIRWQHPERGLLQPADFLDVAEATGLIVPIGAVVIDAACQHGRRLHDAGFPLGVTVNLSAKQFNDPCTAELIRAALDSSGFPAHSLIVEITEFTMLEDTPGVLTAMQAVKALGVQLAIDDFGTGYSSLAYLKKYPIDGLKVDRSFIRDVLDSSDDRTIVASVITLARDLDLWVVAEGVETAEQLDVVLGLGCHLIQGYLFSKPVPPDDLLRTVRALSEAPHGPLAR